MKRRQFLHLAAGAAALPAVSRIASAQVYPTRPAHLISAYAPGGINDLFARLIGQWLSERLGALGLLTIVQDFKMSDVEKWEAEVDAAFLARKRLPECCYRRDEPGTGGGVVKQAGREGKEVVKRVFHL